MWQVKFWCDQLKMAGAWFVGLFVLALPCALKAFDENVGQSIKTAWPAPYTSLNGRSIDGLRWRWLWPWFHNPEDGDFLTPLVWQGTVLVQYNPNGTRWGAYCWLALRNSADGLKYRFALPTGSALPMVSFTLFGMTFRYGYEAQNGYNVPVLEKV